MHALVVLHDHAEREAALDQRPTLQRHGVQQVEHLTDVGDVDHVSHVERALLESFRSRLVGDTTTGERVDGFAQPEALLASKLFDGSLDVGIQGDGCPHDRIILRIMMRAKVHHDVHAAQAGRDCDCAELGTLDV